jgi:hypothetical protein
MTYFVVDNLRSIFVVLSAMMIVVDNEKWSSKDKKKNTGLEKKTVPNEDEILQSRILQLSTGMIFGAWEKISWDSFSNAIYWFFDIVTSKFVTF